MSENLGVLKIGIIRLSALGDCIVSASFLASLRANFQNLNAQIVWFVDSVNAQILKNSPLIDELVILPKGKVLQWRKILKNYCAQNGEFDLLIDMQGLLKSALAGFWLQKKAFLGFSFLSAKEKFAALFYTHTAKIAYERNILERNFELVKKAAQILKMQNFQNLESAIINRANAFGFSESSLKKISQILKISESKRKILLILEASLESKTYAHFAQVISEFQNLDSENFNNSHIFLLTQKSDEKSAQILKNLDSQTAKNCEKINALNLDEVKALVSKMDLVIGGDTGITHLAWALQRPSITLYGNTPAQRFKLLGENNVFLSGSNNPNYSKNDFSINNISPRQIVQETQKLLAKGKR